MDNNSINLKSSIVEEPNEEKEKKEPEPEPTLNVYFNHVKESVGIALCRRCPTTKNLQILLVHKRLSYAFLHFVLGKYNVATNYSDIANLVSNMSVNEKLEILSLNFDHLWYKIWLKVPYNNYNKSDESYHKNWLAKYKNTDALVLNTRDCYKHCRSKFYELISKDGGQKLQNAIMNTAHNRTFLWEIPKGRLDEDEAKVQCAMRELWEETNIKSEQYDICFDIKPFTLNKTYADAKYRYKHTFYIAIMKNNNTPVKVDFNNINQITEIDNLQWYSLNEMNIIWKDIYNSHALKKVIKKIFKCIRNRKLIK
jgi:predicted NUDIX family NTP pyrophosphohydrolase